MLDKIPEESRAAVVVALGVCATFAITVIAACVYRVASLILAH